MVEGRSPGPTPSDGGRPPAGPPSGPLSTPSSPDPPPLRRRVLLIAVVGGLVLVVGLVGVLIGAGAFSGGDRGGGTAGDAPSTPPVSASPSGPSTAPRTSSPPTRPTTRTSPPASRAATGEGPARAFGQTQGYEDGVEVTVSAPVPFTPSDSAAGHLEGNLAVALQITVHNGGDQRLDLATVMVQVRDGEGREGTRVFDGAPPHLGLGLSGTLLPGKKAVGGYGFDLPPAEKPVLDVEVRVGHDRPALFWSGDVG
ncbi:hypothetical protein PV371_18075 [Streptomyces sp. TX20-6-3]|uniref:hypothetical protein n=1 Tax=Streptomyces sp. TX20-6-3 TaxID=3028705 RepID=UPI0029BA459C|nr:hypothetical protein [Streptomyces sp. TX20-6-3]MDX2561555.1 hypothetical protein [Streptomyces sp. TX20-6-3]